MIDEKLLGLYEKSSKHSNYQVLAQRVKALLPSDLISVRSRYERERFDYLRSRLDMAGFSVADIGGNTGFFSFESVDAGVDRVVYYEGNAEHYQFVCRAVEQLGLERRIVARNEYIDFGKLDIPSFDCVFLLNVLHHVGDDFGDKQTRSDEVQRFVVSTLRALSYRTRYLVFQLGFNWKGDRGRPIFSAGTKSEVISLVASAGDAFAVRSIGVAVKRQGGVVYQDLNDDNVGRDDALGEFLNRPLFILKSRNFPDSCPLAAEGADRSS